MGWSSVPRYQSCQGWHGGDDTYALALEAHGDVVLHRLDTGDLDTRLGDDFVERHGRANGGLAGRDVHLEAGERVDDLLLVVLDLLHVDARATLLIVAQEVDGGLAVEGELDARTPRARGRCGHRPRRGHP